MKALLMILMAGVILLMVQGTFANSSKVQVCHIPLGNPGNFHTITVSERALDAHLAHGDLSGPCSDSGEFLCDDGNACTIDAIDPETGTCLVEHPPVDCDDGLLCTTNSCDSTDGCKDAPIVCNDGDLCTVDACSPFDGQCTGTPIDCGPLGVCSSDTGQCDLPCAGITCEPIDQCHEAGQCVLPGFCTEGVEVADGTSCDDGDDGTVSDQCSGGICAGTLVAICPCFTYDEVAYAVSRLIPWDGRNECLKNGEQGESVNTRRITWFDNNDPRLNMGLGESLQGAILITNFNCFKDDWEDNTHTGFIYGTYEEILDCTRIMDQAFTDTATQEVLDHCPNW